MRIAWAVQPECCIWYLVPVRDSQWVIFAAGEGSLLGELGGSELDWGVPPAALQPLLSSLALTPRPSASPGLEMCSLERR